MNKMNECKILWSSSSIAIGFQAGYTGQGAYAVAIGFQAGYTGQGAYAIAIGNVAGKTNQPANSIVINASTSDLSGTNAGFYVKPIRNLASTGGALYYNNDFEIGINSSSIKYKENVVDLNRSTSNIYNVRAREYDWKETKQHLIGYIAEEIDEVDTLFTFKKDGKPEGIEWNNILLYAVEEIKNLKKEILTLRQMIETLSL